MEIPVIVVHSSHLDSGELADALLELEKLIRVGYLHDNRANCLIEASGHDLKSLIKSKVMIVHSQLSVERLEELVLILLIHFGLLEELIKALSICCGCIVLILHLICSL